MSFDLNTLWFVLIAVLFTGFFFLEGFDYGVGILLPFVAKNDKERRVVINTIGPHWDGNEVWLITAGGAIFAAFPHWYATLFSGFYLALFLILVALILRGVAFEFRSKDDNPTWRKGWDAAIFVGSLLPAVLWGVAFANIVRGVPIDGSMAYTGTLFTLLNPFALLGGLVTLALFTLHGALFLSLKTDGVILERVQSFLMRLWVPVVLLTLAFVGYSVPETDFFVEMNAAVIAGLAVAVAGLLATGVVIWRGRLGRAFVYSGATIIGVAAFLFGGLFPRVMPSSLGSEFDLTIYNAASSPYTLQVMSIVALIFVPVVLIYQGWSYWVFRKRVTMDSHLEY
ncbi:MAG TPA: cytochrome d ubiquinol oxidase subunit II [Candidatus Sulfomarinibacteraceae bacterium]|nr:cytochrome d ubiquinol oxidase subunit II [Candidatus Sulfomarinibacteraceae bacterium]